MPAEREFDLVEIILDPGIWIYESYELTPGGHYYLYRYDAAEQSFTKATVPAGAAALHFRPLKTAEKVPFGGWRRLERKSLPKSRPRLFIARKYPST